MYKVDTWCEFIGRNYKATWIIGSTEVEPWYHHQEKYMEVLKEEVLLGVPCGGESSIPDE